MLLPRKVLPCECALVPRISLTEIFCSYTAITGLPGTVQSVVRSTAFEGDRRGPSMQSVLDILQQNGIEVESKKMQVSNGVLLFSTYRSESFLNFRMPDAPLNLL